MNIAPGEPTCQPEPEEMFLANLFRRRGLADAAHALYGAAVAQGRAPVFYRDLGVPDTLEGRFEMICFHVFLVLRRLKGTASDGRASELSQAVFDLMFADMDRNLREIGVGDLSVGRKVKAMAQALYGRIAAYESGITAGEDALAAALQRNVYGDSAGLPTPAAKVLARYMRASLAAMAELPAAALVRGEVAFAPLPDSLPSTEPAT